MANEDCAAMAQCERCGDICRFTNIPTIILCPSCFDAEIVELLDAVAVAEAEVSHEPR